jgi:hypothetical protein
MHFLLSLPLVRDLVRLITDRFATRREDPRDKILEIELETARRAGRHLTPRKALGYLVVFGLALELAWLWVARLVPGSDDSPDILRELLRLAAALFGLGY